MIKDALIIFKKEILNIFRDKRAVFANYVLPLVLTAFIFLVISNVNDRQRTEAVAALYNVVIKNNPDAAFEQILKTNLNWTKPVNNDDPGNLVVEFPAGFTPGNKSTVSIYYDSRSQKAGYAAARIEEALIQYENKLSEKKLNSIGVSLSDLDTIVSTRVDTAPKDVQGTDFIVMMLPYFLLIYLFAGSMAVALDCTAGEKERGGLAILLVNQVSRSSIALGKVLFVIVSALLNSASTFGGLMIAIANMKGFGGMQVANVFQFLTPEKMISLLLVILAMGGLAGSVLVFLGSLAKTMKEGGAYVTPVYMLAIFIGIATMQLDATKNILYFFIPLVNGVFLIKSIIVSQFTLLQLGVTLSINILVVVVLIFFTSKVYNSEKVLTTI